MLVMPNQLDTRRLLIKKLSLENAEEIFKVYASDPRATRFVSWPTHQSVEDTRTFLKYAEKSWKEGSDYSYAILKKPEYQLIGSIGLINETGKVSFGYILGRSHWNKGFATEAVSGFIECLKSLNGLIKIWALCDIDNIASIKVLEKAGLVREAVLANWFPFINQQNQYKDCVIYNLPLANG